MAWAEYRIDKQFLENDEGGSLCIYEVLIVTLQFPTDFFRINFLAIREAAAKQDAWRWEVAKGSSFFQDILAKGLGSMVLEVANRRRMPWIWFITARCLRALLLFFSCANLALAF